MKRIRRLKEKVVFSNTIGKLFNDEVRGPFGDQGNYLRWQWNRSAVSIIPKKGDFIGLAKMFRYPTGRISLEFPRGGTLHHENIKQAALRELLEETGMKGGTAKKLGLVYADSGLIENPLSVVVVNVIGGTEAQTEKFESISKIQWLSIRDVNKNILAGKIHCAITIASFHIYCEAKKR